MTPSHQSRPHAGSTSSPMGRCACVSPVGSCDRPAVFSFRGGWDVDTKYESRGSYCHVIYLILYTGRGIRQFLEKTSYIKHLEISVSHVISIVYVFSFYTK